MFIGYESVHRIRSFLGEKDTNTVWERIKKEKNYLTLSVLGSRSSSQFPTCGRMQLFNWMFPAHSHQLLVEVQNASSIPRRVCCKPEALQEA